MQVWSKSTDWFRRTRMETIFWTFQSAGVTLKIRAGHQNLINSFCPPNNVSMLLWSKSIHWLCRKVPHHKQYEDFFKIQLHINRLDLNKYMYKIILALFHLICFLGFSVCSTLLSIYPEKHDFVL